MTNKVEYTITIMMTKNLQYTTNWQRTLLKLVK